eukprot:2073656-Rhodomonas_salina.2
MLETVTSHGKHKNASLENTAWYIGACRVTQFAHRRVVQRCFKSWGQLLQQYNTKLGTSGYNSDATSVDIGLQPAYPASG